MHFNLNKPLRALSCFTLSLVLGAFTLTEPAKAAFSSPVGIQAPSAENQLNQLIQAQLLLESASMFAFEGASTVQKFQTVSLDSMNPELLKEYMASMIYIPQAMVLPSDEEALDEPWETALMSPLLPNAEDSESKEGAEEQAQTPAAQIQQKVLKLLKPVQSALVSSPFGFRWGRPHQGVDLAAPTGTPIMAAESGTVVFSGWKEGYGNFVSVDHGFGYRTNYAHCSRVLVHNGQKVGKGHIIAKVGNTGRSTGPHLHFEVVAKGVHQNPQKFINNRLTLVKSD